MRALIAAGACAVLPMCVFAQTVVGPPNPQQPSSPNYRTPTVPAQPDYRLPALPQSPSEPAAAPGGGQMFVSRIEVRGVTVFKPAVIATIVGPYQNRVVNDAELETVRVALTRLYIDKGYINSGVILPDQQATGGVVVFQAIEGKLTRVQVGGKTHLSPHYVTARIGAHVADPLNVMDVQYALRYLQQDPNVARLDARLGPGDGLGQAVAQVNIEDQPRFSAAIGADNFQSSSIGAEQGRVSVGARDLTGYGDEFNGTVSHSRGNTLGSGVLSVPVSAHNASAQAYYSRGDAVIIQQPFEALNIKETVRTYGISLTEPIVDRIDNRFAFFLGAESDRAATELLGTGFSFSPGAQNGVSAVAAIFGGLDWLIRGSTSVTDLRLTYRHGIDALGATIKKRGSNDELFNPNPTGADGRFGLEQLQFIYIERLNGFSVFSGLNDRAQLIVRASGQLTQQPLLSLEKFSVGGVDTVRGFPQNLFVRDNGAAATLELQMPVPGYRPEPRLLDLVVAPFVDYGRSWDKANEDQANPLNNTTVARYMAGAGVGLLWNPVKGLDARIYWGRSIANNLKDHDPRPFLPHDAQFHGVYFAANYIVRW